MATTLNINNSEDTFRDIASLFRRKRYKAALNLITSQLENITQNDLHIPQNMNSLTWGFLKNDRTLRTRWSVLQVYCHLKLKNFEKALIPLDALPCVPLNTHHYPNFRSSLLCSSDHFILQLLAAIFPLCVYGICRKDVPTLDNSFPKLTYGSILERLYKLLAWCTDCRLYLASNSQDEELQQLVHLNGLNMLQELWKIRHFYTLRCLVNAFIQLEMYESALKLIHKEILSMQPESPEGLILIGRVYLSMGAMESAEYHFGIAECLCDPIKSKAVTPITCAMLQLAQMDAPAAIAECRSALDISQRKDILTVETSGYHNQQLISADQEYSIALNNLAVSLLYDGVVKEGIHHFETLLLSDFRVSPFFASLRNLLTLYEFSPQGAKKIANLKKRLYELGTDETELLELFTED